MLVQVSRQAGSSHIVVMGNEKGGSGKSTIALHVAVALMKAGQRVATIDLDCRQQSLTRYINNRSAWARRTGLDLELPVHCCIKRGETMQIADNETSEFQQFMDAVSAIERKFAPMVLKGANADRAARGDRPGPPLAAAHFGRLCVCDRIGCLWQGERRRCQWTQRRKNPPYSDGQSREETCSE